MKRLIAVSLILLSAVTLVGCESSGSKYEAVHIDTYHFSGCVEIESYSVLSDLFLKVTTKDYGEMFIPYNCAFLVEDADECPLCNVSWIENIFN